jgi:hypothetical protein
MMDAKELTKALPKGRWHGSYGMACCPAHADRNPSLTIREGQTGAPLLWCQSGCEPGAVIEALRGQGLWEGRGADYTPPDHAEASRRAAEAEAERKRKVDHARDLWRQSAPIEDTLAERYLRERGITGPLPPTLRYLANAKHAPTGLILPALVAAVTHWPERQLRGLHRTFLRVDGRGQASVSDAKMMLGECRGGAVRLAPAGATLAIAEGIETALSVQRATGLPTWAALSTGGLTSLRLPDEVREMTIFADHDENGAGERAARRAIERWEAEGRKARAVMPQTPGTDFNDLWKGAA